MSNAVGSGTLIEVYKDYLGSGYEKTAADNPILYFQFLKLQLEKTDSDVFVQQETFSDDQVHCNPVESCWASRFAAVSARIPDSCWNCWPPYAWTGWCHEQNQSMECSRWVSHIWICLWRRIVDLVLLCSTFLCIRFSVTTIPNFLVLIRRNAGSVACTSISWVAWNSACLSWSRRFLKIFIVFKRVCFRCIFRCGYWVEVPVVNA